MSTFSDVCYSLELITNQVEYVFDNSNPEMLNKVNNVLAECYNSLVDLEMEI